MPIVPRHRIAPGLPLLDSEKAIELNDAAYLRSYLLFRPVFQYYVDIGANPHISDSAVFGFRSKVDFWPGRLAA